MNNYYKQQAYSSQRQIVNGNLVEAKDMRYTNDNGRQNLSSRYIDSEGNVKHIHLTDPIFKGLSSTKKSLKERLIHDFKLRKCKKKKKSSMSTKKISLSGLAKGITKRMQKLKHKKKRKTVSKKKKCRAKNGRFTKCRK